MHHVRFHHRCSARLHRIQAGFIVWGHPLFRFANHFRLFKVFDFVRSPLVRRCSFDFLPTTVWCSQEKYSGERQAFQFGNCPTVHSWHGEHTCHFTDGANFTENHIYAGGDLRFVPQCVGQKPTVWAMFKIFINISVIFAPKIGSLVTRTDEVNNRTGE